MNSSVTFMAQWTRGETYMHICVYPIQCTRHPLCILRNITARLPRKKLNAMYRFTFESKVTRLADRPKAIW